MKINLLKLCYFYFMYTDILPASTMGGFGTSRLEFLVMSHYVSARNQTHVLWKSSQCSQPLSHLSSLSNVIVNVEKKMEDVSLKRHVPGDSTHMTSMWGSVQNLLVF